MALRTVSIDKDGDGTYDDVIVVNTIEENVPHHRPHYRSEMISAKTSSSSRDIFKPKTRRKIILFAIIFLFGLSLISGVSTFILAMIMSI